MQNAFSCESWSLKDIIPNPLDYPFSSFAIEIYLTFNLQKNLARSLSVMFIPTFLKKAVYDLSLLLTLTSSFSLFSFENELDVFGASNYLISLNFSQLTLFIPM